MRKIIHVDMDAFFAAIEQRDDPALRGRPIAVGSGAGRGVVMTASYEARPFGVRSAMPSATAKQLCSELLFVPARMDVYRAVARQIRAIFARHADAVEPLSVDEAYLDVTAAAALAPATAIARQIKQEIRAETGLTGSAGVSINKFLAKIASDLEKPDGLTVIRPEEALAFIGALPIERFHGVGPVTARKLHASGLTTGADLRAMGFDALVRRFGRHGAYLWQIANGRDERNVNPDRLRKSVGCERTFGRDLSSRAELESALLPIAQKLEQRIRDAAARPRTLTLKVKDDRFRIQTRARGFGAPILDADRLHEAGRRLLDEADLARPIRLLGLTVSQLEGPSPQPDLFDDNHDA